MNKKFRFALFVFIVLTVLVLAGCAGKSYDLAAEEGDIYAGTVPTISVTGTGKLEATPDTANVRFEVNAWGNTAEEAQAVIEEAIAKVTGAVKAKGVDTADIKTEDYYVYQEYEYDGKGNRTGEFHYYAYTSVNVKAREVDGVSAVIDAAVNAGANFTGGIYFTIDDKSAFEGEALKLAYDNARAKAEIVCEAAGHKVGEAIVITDGITEMPEVIYRDDVPEEAPMPDGEMGNAAGSSISPGTLTITSKVTVRFIME